MKRFSSTALALGLVLGALPSSVAAAPLQPTKAWNLDYGETGCAAIRDYGEAGKPFLLALRPSPNGKTVQLILMSPGRVFDAKHVPVTVKFAGTTLKTTGLRHESENKEFEILRMNLDRAALDPIRGASMLEIEAKNALDGSFALSSISKVMDGLDKCTLDLQNYWNVGQERTAGFRSSATSVKPLISYLSWEDYPAQALSENREGDVAVVLMIDEEGKLKDCAVEATSGVAVLDAQTCIKLRKAEFRPAIGASGEPVRSVFTQRVRWRLP